MANKPLLPRVISISSGKGGVGKSSICINLGISLAKAGSRVCVLDADIGLANANILLGITPEFTLEHVLYGAKSIEEVMLDGPHGLKIIPGANGISECAGLHPRQQIRLTRELARIEGDYDYLLIDTAAGVAPTTLDFICASHCALIVVTPEPTSLTDAFSMIKLLKRRHGDLQYQIVVNMSKSAGQSKEVFHRFSSAVEKYVGIHCNYLGFILRDESMRAAVVLQNPVAMFPDTDPSSQSFKRLADKLDSATADVSVEPAFSEYWQRRFSSQHTGAESRRLVPVDSSPKVAVVKTKSVENEVKKLRTKLMQLIENSDKPSDEVRSLLKESVDSFVDLHQELPIDILGLCDHMIASPDHYEKLLSTIAERLKPWVIIESVATEHELSLRDMVETHDLENQPPAVVTVPDLHFDIVNDKGEIIGADIKSVDVDTQVSMGSQFDNKYSHQDHSDKSLSSKPIAGAYDSKKFGSQESLLELLRGEGNSSTSLIDVLSSL